MVRIAVSLVVAAALVGACDRGASSKGGAAATTRAVVRPTVASLVPAATDILVGMGAGGHLVGISNYDVARGETEGLPMVGDYQSMDWERLTAIRPDVLVVFQSPERVPAGMRERADGMGMKLVNIRTETLEDLYKEIGHLGEVVGEREKAARAVEKLKGEMEGVREKVAGKGKVKTLILRDERAAGAVGTGNFLDDALEVAGGVNVIRAQGWPTVDREQVLALDPDVIVLLLSGVESHVEQSAREALKGMSGVRAVREGRAYVINEWYSQQPGFRLGELAGKIAVVLHPEAK